jgi:hypothetical protein
MHGYAAAWHGYAATWHDAVSAGATTLAQWMQNKVELNQIEKSLLDRLRRV